MERLNQEYALRVLFHHSLEREELLLSKYRDCLESIDDKKKNAELLALIKEFENDAREHVALLKDKMIKLNIQS